MKVFVKVKTGSKNEFIAKTGDNSFTVSVREAPVDDRANWAIIRAIAQHFKVAQSRVNIMSGFKSRQKVLEVEF